MARIRVLLVDDHQLVRAGIRALVEKMADVEVVGEVANGRDALRAVETLRPNLVLMDIVMEGLNGLDATARIVKRFPGIRVIILSMNTGEDSVLQALRAGAAGYLVKSADPVELELAVRAVARGEMYLSSTISGHVVAACLQRVSGEHSALDKLSPRHREILQLIAEGHSTKEISRTLELSPKTVECYRVELMNTLDIHDIASLTRFAIRTGIAPL